MSPRPAPVGKRVIVKLVVPDDVVRSAFVDAIESSAERIGRSFARAATARLQRGVLITRKNILLAECILCLYLSSKPAGALGAPCAAGKGRGVELEHEPPVDGVTG